MEILLTTLNATYAHCAFGLRYLYANLGELKSLAKIQEFTIAQNPRDIAEQILNAAPRVIGFSVYIWNTRQTEEVISVIKQVSPQTIVVIGGPEVSYETEGQNICALADYVFKGESDFLFRDFCENYFSKNTLPRTKFISGPLPDIKSIALPYDFYSDQDIKHRVLYVEASRGCPYKCEFCLSSLDTAVRNFDLPTFLGEMDKLIEKGARQFKFVDRTFNLNINISRQILEFFLKRISLGLFLHFELVPDRLPPALKDLIVQFPEGSLQFEIGVQTWNPSVGQLISRKQDYESVKDNFQFLAEKTHVHTHADLIVGLPGEDYESFGKGFNALYSLRPHEIQVGILKRLKGTPIARHEIDWELKYQPTPPFSVVSTKTLPFAQVQFLTRFAKFWDLFANSGNFPETLRLFPQEDMFKAFADFVSFLETRHSQTFGIALVNLVESAWVYLTTVKNLNAAVVRRALVSDYCERVRRDIPIFLRDENYDSLPKIRRDVSGWVPVGAPKRQQRHLQ